MVFILAFVQTLVVVLAWFGVTPMTIKARAQGRSRTSRQILGRDRSGLLLMAVIMLLTWAVVAWNYYNGPHSPPSMEAWSKAASNLKIKTGNFSHQTIPIDGYKLVDCDLSGATLVYNGTKPAEFSCHGTGGGLSIKSDNPAIQQALILMEELCRVSKIVGGDITCQPREELPPLP